MAKQKKDIGFTVQKEYPDFANDVDGLSVAALEVRLSTYAKEMEKTIEAQQEDQKLTEARELASELAGPYNDVKKAIRLKTSYIIKLIRDKGGVV